MHPEDHNMYAANYHFSGAEKRWFSVPTKYYMKIKNALTPILGDEANLCDQFLRHKNLFINPEFFHNIDVPVNYTVI